MPDVVHDPDTDWCACEPHSLRRCEYRMLADAVSDAFNPPDGDEGEVSLLITAVENARAMLAAFTCYCTPATLVATSGALEYQRTRKPVTRQHGRPLMTILAEALGPDPRVRLMDPGDPLADGIGADLEPGDLYGPEEN